MRQTWQQHTQKEQRLLKMDSSTLWTGHGTSSRTRYPYHRATGPSQGYGTSSTGLRCLQPDPAPSAGHDFSRNRPRYPQHQTAASKAGLQHQKTNWAAKIRTGLRPHSFRKLHAEIVTKEDDNNRMYVKG